MTAVVPTAPPSPGGAVPRRRPRLVRALGTASLVLSGLFLVAAVALPHLGLRVLAVESGSMAPAIPEGSVVLARHVPVAELEDGQVISFYPPTERPRLTTHRIVAVDRTRGGTIVTTRGDANPGDDPWRAELLDERCWVVVGSLPVLGRAADVLRSPAGLTVVAFVLPVVFLVSTLRLIWRRPDVPTARPRARQRSRGSAGRAATVLSASLVFTVVLGLAGEAYAAFTASASRGHTVASAVLRAPTGLTVRNACVLTLAAVDVAWTSASPGASGHRIERRRSGTVSWTTLATVPATSNHHQDPSVALLTTYEYRISPVRGPWTGTPSTATLRTAGTC